MYICTRSIFSVQQNFWINQRHRKMCIIRSITRYMFLKGQNDIIFCIFNLIRKIVNQCGTCIDYVSFCSFLLCLFSICPFMSVLNKSGNICIISADLNRQRFYLESLKFHLYFSFAVSRLWKEKLKWRGAIYIERER